jgi:hypothetical protein
MPAPRPKNLPAPTPTPAPLPEPTPEASPSPTPKRQIPIRGFWEDAKKEGRQWTAFAVDAMDHYGQTLMKAKPKDVVDFCPAYGTLDKRGRKHFWVKLLSAIAAAESNYQTDKPYKESFVDSSKANVISRGLLQISMESANGYGCGIEKQTDLDDAQTNIECGVRILEHWIPQDEVISDSDEDNWYGAARYWSVTRSTSKKLKIIQQLLKRTALCRSN